MRAARGGAEARAGRGRRLRSWLAICSLLAQLTATAGHFHPEDFAFLAGKAEAAALGASGGQGGGGPSGSGQPGAPAHDDCSLCFSLQLAGTSALPALPAMPVPSAQGMVASGCLCEIRRAAPPHLLFQTRAPPIA